MYDCEEEPERHKLKKSVSVKSPGTHFPRCVGNLPRFWIAVCPSRTKNRPLTQAKFFIEKHQKPQTWHKNDKVCYARSMYMTKLFDSYQQFATTSLPSNHVIYSFRVKIWYFGFWSYQAEICYQCQFETLIWKFLWIFYRVSPKKCPGFKFE